MVEVYRKFAEDFMAVPVIMGVKTESERFAGAEETYCIEAMMQDGKALQAGTSHFLGQNFAKSFEVTFMDKNNSREYPWATSWGVSTRLIGALIMAHSDDQGLVLPPKLAPIQVVIVPVYKTNEDVEKFAEATRPIIEQLKAKGVRVKYDSDDQKSPGFKFAEYELQGVPVRITVGSRELESSKVEITRRDTGEKSSLALEGLAESLEKLLEAIQTNIFEKAKNFRAENTFSVDSWDEFKSQIEKGGFVMAHWDGTAETENKIKEETKATIRCVPLESKEESGKCVFSGNPSKKRVLFAKAY
jgi:prolyl-tRNA synthetase